MIKWINKSLNTKIFIATFSMLMFVGAAIYGIVLVAMPNTYQTVVDNNLEIKLKDLQDQLNKGSLEEGKKIIADFAQDNYVDVVISDEANRVVAIEGKTADINLMTSFPNFENTIIDEKQAGDLKYYSFKMNLPENEEEVKNVPFVVNLGEMEENNLSAPIQFSGSNDVFRVTLINNHVVVKEASDILFQLMPLIVGVLLLISFVVALFFSRRITKPIKAVSQTALRMATLDLHCEETKERQDEIGILTKSLNQMATKLTMTLDELETANHTLEADIQKERELEQRRRDFFAAVSHELKTPITIIKGQLEGMIYKVGKYKDRDTYLSQSLEVIDQMEGMVQEILSISRLESSKFKLEKQSVSLTALMTECMKLEEDLAERKKIKVEWQIDPLTLIMDTIFVDTGLMKRVLTNIINNGIYHSAEGEYLKLRIDKEEQGLSLSVENTGVHIKEEEIPKLFEAFYRLDKSRNRHTGGTGLGLYIAKLILDMHGFSFKLENSQEGVQFKINFTQNTN